jgi:hypothetical protein
MKQKICPGVFDAGHWAKNENNRNPPKNFPNIFFVLLSFKNKIKNQFLSEMCLCYFLAGKHSMYIN